MAAGLRLTIPFKLVRPLDRVLDAVVSEVERLAVQCEKHSPGEAHAYRAYAAEARALRKVMSAELRRRGLVL